MSCNTFIPIMDLVREVEALLAANYIDKDDPRITGGVFTNPTIAKGFLLDVDARLEFCRLVQECGLDAPFGKMWLARPLSPGGMLISYEESGQPLVKWASIQTTMEQAGILGAAPTSLASRLAAEVTQARTAEAALGSRITAVDDRLATNITNTDNNTTAIFLETSRATGVEQVLSTDVAELKSKDIVLQEQVNSIGGGKKGFPTYAQMEIEKATIPANSSVDVVADPDPLKNGTYVYNGTTFTKSLYDPLTLAKADATAKANNAKAEAIVEASKNVIPRATQVFHDGSVLIDIVAAETGYYDFAGAYVSSNTSSTSTLIPVKAGECYLLTAPYVATTTNQRPSFLFYGPDRAFKYGLAGSKAPDHRTNERGRFNTKIGVYSNLGAMNTVGVIIPEDGFISVTTWTDGVLLNPSANAPVLLRTNYVDFISSTQIQAPKNVMLAFKDVFKTLKIDKDIAGNGSRVISTASATGAPIAYLPAAGFVSTRYPVTVGEHIHIHMHTSHQTAFRLIFEDGAGNFVGRQDIVNEHSLTANGAGYVGLNIPSPFTGFFRVAVSNENFVPALVGVTKDRVSYATNYIRSGDALDFYKDTSGATPTKFNSPLTRHSMVSLASTYGVTDTSFTPSLPRVLRKGDVLEYTLEATNYATLAVIFPRNHVMELSAASYSDTLSLNASDLLDIEQGKLWILDGQPSAIEARYYANAKSATVAYCNEEEDVVVVFMRPSAESTHYSAFKQSLGYRVTVYTKPEYILKRDRELADRFTKISKLMASDTTNSLFHTSLEDKGSGTYPPVLLFKGEVLSYLNNYTGGGSAHSLDLSRGKKTRADTVTVLDNLLASVANTTATRLEYKALNITKASKLSYRHAQVYAHETCIFVGNIKTLDDTTLESKDVDGMIRDKYYPARIIPLKDIVIGQNIMPTFHFGTKAFYANNAQPELRQMKSQFIGDGDTVVTFAPKDHCLELSWWSDFVTVTPLTVPVASKSLAPTVFKPVYCYDKKGELTLSPTQEGGYKVGLEVPEDVIVVLPSGTNKRTALGMFDPAVPHLDPLKPIMLDTYKHSVRGIPTTQYEENYKVTSDTRLNIPETTGIRFNFCTPNSISLDYGQWAIMQVIKDNQVIAVFNALTANQGQSTALSERKNVNIELANDKYKDVFIKFGDYEEEAEVVLKSYLNSDKGHFKDTTSCNLWHAVRTTGVYPENSLFPESVMENVSRPWNLSARGTPFGIPVELHRGGNFNSLASLRSKKKRENYAMEKSNLNQILLQADWQLKGSASGQITWNTVDLAFFEIRVPSMTGYIPGATELPIEYKSVETASKRILDWLRGGYTSTIDMRATYQDYINLESFLDYGICIDAAGSWDGVGNNFLLGTYDATIWNVFWYDSDQTWGTKRSDVLVPHTQMLGSNGFRTILNVFAVEARARYAYLRRSGILDAKWIQGEMKRLDGMIHAYSKVQDAKYWGELLPGSTLPYSMKWAKQRIEHLDTYYQYTA